MSGGRGEAVVLDGASLDVAGVVRVAREDAPVSLAPAAEAAVDAGRRRLEEHARAGRRIYGMTTGVGALDGAAVTDDEGRAFQRNLLLSHAAGVGAPMSRERVRAMLLARANVLAKGRSGIAPATLGALVAMIANGVFPVVPEIGSVGASDLAALAHATLPLIGEGWAFVDDDRVPGKAAMERAGVALPPLGGRDALALVNGTSQSLGTGALAVHDASKLVAGCEIAAAMSMVGAASQTDFLDPRHAAPGEREDGVCESAKRLRELVGGAAAAASAGGSAAAMREPLSTRCAPQVLGAARESVARARRVVDRELNATIDNPSLFPDGDLANNAGTMDAQALSEALDALATSAISVAVMSERRTARLLDPALNGGLPAFLVHPRAKPGVCSGLMIAQYTAAALVAELRAASAPASVQSLPVSNGTEDHGSMSALAARRAATVIGNATLVVAVELLVAAQAVDLRGAVGRLPPPLAEAHRALRGRVPVMIDDRLLGDDIDAAASCLQNIA